MGRITILVGLLLVALGLAGFLVLSDPESRSVTALIPAFFGVPMAILGVLAAAPSRRKLVMHIAVVLGLLGAIGSARGLTSLPALLSGGELERPSAVAVQSIMFAICAVFVVLCVISFVKARRGAAAAD